MLLADSHAHLDDRQFDPDRPAVLARAREAGVEIIVNVAFDLASCHRALQLAEEYAPVYATVGVHPHGAARAPAGYLRVLRSLARHSKVVALGEMGLDYYRDLSPRPVQQRVFREQLSLAAELGMPAVIHSRNAHGDLLAILEEIRPPVPVVLHCYSGDWSLARRCLALGCYLSFAGPVTYPQAGPLQEVARKVPLDRLLVETDAPYLPPVPHRGRRNESAYVALVVEKIAELRGIPAEEVAAAAFANTRRVFGIC